MSVDVAFTPVSKTSRLHIISYVPEWLHFYISKPFWNKKPKISLDHSNFLHNYKFNIYIYVKSDLVDFIEQLYIAEKMA